MQQNDTDAQAHALLKHFYGYDTFRPGQLEVIEAAVGGRDTLVLMPTGGGKSVCYQIPAMMMEGCAVVVSPLIALMHDQVTALTANGIPAAAVNSTYSEQYNRDAVENAAAGRIKLLYVSPEKLMSDIGMWAGHLKVSLFAIDEAHCISQWGHDFRPVYTALSRIKEVYAGVPVMALTATADRLTRDDIAAQLRLSDPLRWTGSFDRPNLSLSVESGTTRRDRVRAIRAIAARHRGDSGVVYCLSRKTAEAMNEALNAAGVTSVCYHAGMGAEQREQAQRAFVRGDVTAVCATVAFGMGIDKSNIRWVVHNNLPQSIENYYQEIGRAGRDGAPAETVLFYSYSDVATIRNFIDESGRPLVNSVKFRRMLDYAEATVCRRRILLSYFGQEMDHDCGNCDVCRNPPDRFDGTVTAQKALSTVVRTGEKTGLLTVVDILRGGASQAIVAAGYNRLTTHGIGRDMSTGEWNDYLMQMIQLGLLEVAYDDANRLKVTGYGWKVLRGQARVTLSRHVPRAYERGQGKAKQAARVELSADERLLDAFKALRKRIADEEGVAPYLVMNDATLADMVARRPLTVDDMAAVQGVSVKKAVKYYRQFTGLTRKEKGLPATQPAGAAQRETALLYRAGLPVQEMARIRRVTADTVMMQLADLVAAGEITDTMRIMTEQRAGEICRWLDSQPPYTPGEPRAKAPYSRGEIRMARVLRGKKP